MHVFNVVVSTMSEIPKPITVNHDSYNIAPSSHPLASTLNLYCHSLPSRAYNYVTVNKQNLDTRHDLVFFIFEVKIQENAHLDLHAASKLHSYIAVDLRHYTVCHSAYFGHPILIFFHSQGQNKYRMHAFFVALRPTLWNSRPHNVKSAGSFIICRCPLKIYLSFDLVNPPVHSITTARQIHPLVTTWLFLMFTTLLNPIVLEHH